MYRKSFTRSIILLYAALFISLLCLISWALHKRLSQQTLGHLKTALLNESQLAALSIPLDGMSNRRSAELQAQALKLHEIIGYRVTLMGREGTVLADSATSLQELNQLENHADRPEMKTALNGTPGTSIRHSMTIHKNLLYAAVPLKKENQLIGVLRLAMPLEEVEKNIFQANSPVLFFLGTTIVAILLFGLFISYSIDKRTRQLLEMVSELNPQLASNFSAHGGDDLNNIADTMNSMAKSLKEEVQNLGNEKTKLTALLNHMAEGVIGVNAAQDILIANPSAEKILHASEGSLITKNILEITHEPKVEIILKEAISKQRSRSAEIHITYPEEKILKVSAIGLPQSLGGMCGMLVFYDVTNMRRLEKLRQEFVANVSHELKTPLTSIKGFLETLLGGALKDFSKSESFLKMMQEDSERLTRLIDDLLELSRIESKEISLKPKPLLLQSEINKAVAVLQPKADSRQIKIYTSLSEDSLKVYADPDRLKQIFLNLLDNAIKFNKAGGEIRISAQKIGSEIIVNIKDTGVGIPAASLQRVFERFYRVDKSRTSDSGGTGLGLSIVKHLIEAHGGTVSCQSVAGQGSLFSITLPSA